MRLIRKFWHGAFEKNHPMRQPALDALELLLNNGIALSSLAQNLYESGSRYPLQIKRLGLSAPTLKVIFFAL